MGQGAVVTIMVSVKYPRLDDVILKYANETPEKVAIRYQEQELSYAELSQRVEALSFYLHVNSINEGKFVAVILDPAEDIIVAMLAIFRVGAIYVPLDPQHPDARIRDQIKAVSPIVVLTQSRYNQRLQKLGVNTVCIDEFKAIDIPATVRSDFDPAAPACVFFTSGSTGEQKAVLATYESLSASIIEPSIALGLTAEDTVNSIARYAWSISMLELLGTLVQGGTTLILDRQRALDMNWLAQQAKLCSAFHCPPALLKHLAEHIERSLSPKEFSDVLLVWYGGDVLTKESIHLLHKVFPNARIGTAYGTTEILGLSHCHFYNRISGPEKVMIGKPVGSITQMLINDGKAVKEIGGVGEIYLGGPRVSVGYLENPDLTAEKFIRFDGDRYFATGDFARRDEYGDLEYLQRKDSQIKIRGNRVDIGEIEHYLRANRSVKDAAIVAKKDVGEQTQLHAFLVFRKDAESDLEGTRRYLAGVLPEYMLPSIFIKLDELPYTENFKIDRKALQELAKIPTASELLPVTERESTLARLWEKVGCTKPMSGQDNFFETGGNSIAAVTLVTLINDELECYVDVADIYRNPKLSEQAALLEIQRCDTSTRHIKNDGLIIDLGDKTTKNFESIFIVAGLGDHVGSYQLFANSISGSWDTYGVLNPSFKGHDSSTIEKIAEISAANILDFKPNGPYYIVGYSMGGLVAVEIARVLKKLSVDVKVVLLDTKPTELPPLKPLIGRLPIYARGYAAKYFSKGSAKAWSKMIKSVFPMGKATVVSDPFTLAFQSGEMAVHSYVTSACPVPTVLVRSEEIPWWEDVRAWADDYGWSDIVDLKGVIRCPGTHLSIVKSKNHWRTTGAAIGQALRKLSLNKRESEIILKDYKYVTVDLAEASEMVG